MTGINRISVIVRAVLDAVMPAKDVAARLARIELMLVALIVERLAHNGDVYDAIIAAATAAGIRP